MKRADVFPSRFLRADDLAGRSPVVTIARVELQAVGADRKVVVFFEGKDKGLIINRTNFRSIVEITGREDTDDWPGHKIKLVTAQVEFQGRRVSALRVEHVDG